MVFKEVSVQAKPHRSTKSRNRLGIAAFAVIAIGILAAAVPEFASGPVAEARLVSVQQAQPVPCLPDGTPIADVNPEAVESNFLPAIYGDGSTPSLMARLEAL